MFCVLSGKREIVEKMEVKREVKEREFGDESIQTVLFTAGTAVLMACLKRFIMMFFIEQWRLWVFLVLNVVLLAILFTSYKTSSTTTNQEDEKLKNVKRVEEKEEKCEENVKGEEEERAMEDDEIEVIEDGGIEEEEEEEESPRLSKEELNERVEAFIATFRRQLASDAIRSRNQCGFSKRSEIINGGFVKLGTEEVY